MLGIRFLFPSSFNVFIACLLSTTSLLFLLTFFSWDSDGVETVLLIEGRAREDKTEQNGGMM
jgi:hypothetical protein